MKKLVLFLLIILSSQHVSSQSYLALVDSADFHISKENWAKAESFILDALRKEPANYNNSLLLSNLATIQRNQNRNKEAINNYSLALNITPNAVTVLKNRASLLLSVDSIEAAYADYKKIITLDEKDIESRYYLGMIALEFNDMILSKESFDEILKINSKSIEGKEGYAIWHKLNGKFDEAITYYNELINNDPALSYLSGRAECFLAKKQLKDASIDINDALKINPYDGYLYLLKARLNKLQYLNDEAAKNAALAVKYGVDKNIAAQVIK